MQQKEKKSVRLRDSYKYYHVTLKGHEFINPFPLADLITCFACKELGGEQGQPHTHVGLEFTSKRLARTVLEDLTKANKFGGQIHLTSAPHFSTIVGYHLGFGDKEPCDPKPFFFKPADFDIEAYRAAGRGHQRKAVAIAKRNAELIQKPLRELLDTGQLSIMSFCMVKKARTALEDDEKAEIFLKREAIPLEGLVVPVDRQSISIKLIPDPNIKRRHIWIWSNRASTGKSTFIRTLAERFRSIKIQPNGQRDQGHPDPSGAQLALIDAAAPGTLHWQLIESLTDSLPIRVFQRTGGVVPPSGLVVVIAANHKPDAFFKKEIFTVDGNKAKQTIFFSRFNVVEFVRDDDADDEYVDEGPKVIFID